MQTYFDITINATVLSEHYAASKLEVINRFWFESLDAASAAHADAAATLRPYEALGALNAPGINGAQAPAHKPAIAATAPIAVPEQPLDTAMVAFVAGIKAKVDAYYGRHFVGTTPPTIYADPPGQKMIRVVSEAQGVKSAFCFVEMATGNILKAARWGMAAKGVRGNIFDADHGLGGVTAYGARNLRQQRRQTRRSPRPLLRKPGQDSRRSTETHRSH